MSRKFRESWDVSLTPFETLITPEITQAQEQKDRNDQLEFTQESINIDLLQVRL